MEMPKPNEQKKWQHKIASTASWQQKIEEEEEEEGEEEEREEESE